MPSYAPYPIANMRTGLELGVKPWLVPADAFTVMNNCFLKDGALEKRRGYASFVTTGDTHAVVGIMTHVKSDGSQDLMVHDTKRLYKLTAGSLADQDLSDQLTGDAGDLISWANYGGSLYMTNNKDRPRVWDGTSVADMTIDISDDAANDLTVAALVTVSRERLIFLGTTEDGTSHPQRARWCVAGDPTDWTNDGYADAPTGEWIRGTDYLGDDVIVWFDNSVWWLRYTGDSDLPFRWERIDADHGSVALHGTANIQAQPVALSPVGFVVTDGLAARRFDSRIPDLAMTFDATYAANAFAAEIADDRQLWVLYPTIGQTTPDKAIILNYEDGSWAQADMPMVCIGHYRQSDSVAWEDASGAWEDQTEVWVAGKVQAGFPIPLAGNSSGTVYRLNYTKNDAGSAVEMTATTGRLNPFVKQGRRARLGKIGFLADSDGSITVKLYADYDTDAYQTETIDLSDGDGQRAWFTVYVGAIANFHRIEIGNSSTGERPIIHAIVPYFRAAGRVAIDG